MAATFQSPYGSMARDYLTFRTVNAKRKSAVEILQETKSLFVKSEAVLDAEQRLVKAAKCDGGNYVAYDSANRKDPTLAKIRRKVQPTHTRSCSDQLQTNLRRLLNSSSKENVADVSKVYKYAHVRACKRSQEETKRIIKEVFSV
uniref:Uncharacterized protein n=1 Tax=Lygus hesperus TaxID=30085 RepID=A0A0A9WNF7_LYGHE